MWNLASHPEGRIQAEVMFENRVLRGILDLRWGKCQEDRGRYMMTSLVICTVHLILLW
jgi:hypothetical protein